MSTVSQSKLLTPQQLNRLHILAANLSKSVTSPEKSGYKPLLGGYDQGKKDALAEVSSEINTILFGVKDTSTNFKQKKEK